jgi:peptide/nickel transport system permease protein
VLLSELAPNVTPVIVVATTTTLGWMILETAGLSFLGLGAQPPTADLGGMLGQGRHLMITAPHVSLVPGAMIFLIAAALNLLGDGLRDALDPELRSAKAPKAAEAAQSSADAVKGALLDVRELSVEFVRDQPVLQGISFSVGPGERVGLVGESGSGKSVTALTVLDLLESPGRVTGGAIAFDGQELGTLTPEQRRSLAGRRMAFVPQDPSESLHPSYRVGAQIAEALIEVGDMDRQQAQRRAVELLDQVQIPDAEARARAYPHELSGGMRQRVAIAMALANQPDLLIADEPTTALDVTTQAEIIALLQRLSAERKLALLFISHDLGVISQLCERVVVLYRGQVVEIANVNRLLSAPKHEYTRRLLAAVPRLGEPERVLAAARRQEAEA